MASNPGRDRRPDALTRLHSSAPPQVAVPDRFVDSHGDTGDDEDDGTSRAPAASGWDLSSPPGWLDIGGSEHPAAGGDAPDVDRVRRRPGRKGPAVAPPAAVALVAVGVLACIVTAYTVFRGPSDDSPTAAPVAFPASAGVAAPAVPGSSSESAARPAPATSSPAAAPTEVVVSVVGLVRTPGLVRLPGAARVADAIERAGGGRPGADLLSLNMAQPVRDGDQILVGFADPASGMAMHSAVVPAGTSGSAPSPSGPRVPGAAAAGPSSADNAPVNLNTADAAALDTLPGVGPVMAQAIIEWRTRNGRFTSVDQLGEVDGIGPGRLSKLRDRVTV